ncbi:hypothetical protein AB0L82_30495 [Nocardia sp. NPDC052001]|uniref:hypothetical protein n=1 Tax=Nocardia sp. NPDC052001 TaxID=3154853 RepID=UPI00342E1EE5
MRALVPALRTAVVMIALAGAGAASSAIAAAAPIVGSPTEVAAPATLVPVDNPYGPNTGSAALDWGTIFLGLPTGSLQKPCVPTGKPFGNCSLLG